MLNPEFANWTHLVPDWRLIGIGGAACGLCATLGALLWLRRAWSRERSQLRGELARIFEQLDLLRFDAQQPQALAASAVPRVPAADLNDRRQRESAGGDDEGDYRLAARLAARGSSAAEIATRCSLPAGEIRVLVALEQARARRAAS